MPIFDRLFLSSPCRLSRIYVVHGIRITRKSTGATLFLPASGACLGTSIGKNAGSWGSCWSSSLDTDDPNYACCLYFRSDDSGWGVGYRSYGLAVRPVAVDF